MHRSFFKILPPNFYALGAGEFFKGQKKSENFKFIFIKNVQDLTHGFIAIFQNLKAVRKFKI